VAKANKLASKRAGRAGHGSQGGGHLADAAHQEPLPRLPRDQGRSAAGHRHRGAEGGRELRQHQPLRGGGGQVLRLHDGSEISQLLTACGRPSPSPWWTRRPGRFETRDSLATPAGTGWEYIDGLPAGGRGHARRRAVQREAARQERGAGKERTWCSAPSTSGSPSTSPVGIRRSSTARWATKANFAGTPSSPPTSWATAVRLQADEHRRRQDPARTASPPAATTTTA